MNRTILADMLGDDYEIIEAGDGTEAVAILEEQASDIALMLLDIFMKEMDGFEVLAMMNSRGWIEEVPVVMVSSEKASTAIRRCYELGCTDFINRPFDSSVVQHRVSNTLMLYATQDVLREMVAEQIQEREKSIGLMISILSQVVEFRNGESGLHVLHVNTLTRMLLEQLVKDKIIKLTPQDINDITIASSLHDIGKISIPDEIINKPGRFTDEEFEIMKTHSAVGADMLKNLPAIQNEPLISVAYEICRWHHERWDGKGYPDGLEGDEIPLSAQVVSLADVYDALTSERVYKKAFSHEKAMEMILGGECGQFNPALLECFEKIADEVHEELKLDSLDSHTTLDSQRAVSEIARPTVAGPSKRTLDLLEFERMKFDFYGKMSKEVQFEYVTLPPMLTVHDWGTRSLGLPEVIMNPVENPELIEIFGEEQIQEFMIAIHKTTPEDTIIEQDLRAMVDGEPRWFHLFARSLWEEDAERGEQVFTGFIGKLIDIHDSVLRLNELENKATHDSLTGLTNHEFARQLITEHLHNPNGQLSVIMVIDVDKFKDVNDGFGHLHGDKVLKALADALRNAVRDNDIVSRVGGDEFMIYLECDVEPEPLVHRIYDSVAKEMKKLDVTISMGVACIENCDIDYSTLFAAADQLLYDMKDAGRNRYDIKVFNVEDFQEGGQYADLATKTSEGVVSKIESDDKDRVIDGASE